MGQRKTGPRTRIGTLCLMLAAVLSAALMPAASAAPPTPDFGAGIDAYAAHEPQSACEADPKPGVVGFKDLLVATYGERAWGISRSCDQGGVSEHKDGRALDYAFDVTDAAQRAEADDLLGWLLATDRHGNAHALARRLGIMYIIWNNRIWLSVDPQWKQYNDCADGSGDPTACHRDHVHFSFGWPGARKETTWWTASAVSRVD
ncbi:hypothetical protein [Saccharothrix algeriensis]|uniref:ARB-07466-like C-terminal domain-containing protein n=1 Tax=Saccharothrix algeriensis TaxID=173560 RepID=A0A8T8HYB6_9PSEU|nr:hypothetical protein [Saccharothrix algeriensis]MBM7815149.1 hypothetical protein [Saccharothrix algeriensis]QTR03397.1 hypothetical protein J7S33_31565 [Saccharothrix algeriensis]